ncbi:Holliday junction branch migration protein RuvA [Conexibacter sp. JD483]|uniref:Holliday junction branch migration protein RuvA n=1 Tax=unclassified Conexibacter TaxID=2627773 RepID=UPI002725917C|nr:MULTISPECIES: Holliday junction branch migration protein RuvA [unclassified Conexibacter]MDO8185142.1 Holliday junction branch migration protein RuvA [Conexibacter sp. CPCC 205706]MDO8196852.1 Holliday junction branch migration protein RuvA [Conexibacter sp. CPCC 205762]MDR9368628.1 Holliday junction branch migration protein RuvA [Conexibacter sp. JD483]
MIALVRGEVAGRRPAPPAGGEVVIDAGGVGYRLAVSGETLKQVPAVGKQVMLHSHMVVREDAMQLYGFATEEERDLFLMLLGVQSVGPRIALAVLSGGSPRELLSALAAGDVRRFQAVPGIGRRTAERIIVELRSKAGASVPDDALSANPSDDPRTFARDGLLGLGFSLEEADRLLARAPGTTAEELIAHALRTARR